MGIGLELTQSAKELLARKGYDPQYGARPLKRTIQSLVEDSFSEALLDRVIAAGDVALVDADNDTIVIRKKGGATVSQEKSENRDGAEEKAGDIPEKKTKRRS
jgi:ATP-dependent Clp protease ATP-binding subunit ClpC